MRVKYSTRRQQWAVRTPDPNRSASAAFAAALGAYGAPGEVLQDIGKQFTDRFGAGGEVLFDRICRDDAIVHRLTQPRSPTTTGKVERFHQTLGRELLDKGVPFADLAAAQAAMDAWVSEYNTIRPHQALGLACPADRFDTTRARGEQELLPLRSPAAVRLAAVPQPQAQAAHELRSTTSDAPAADDEAVPTVARPWRDEAVELASWTSGIALCWK